MNANARPTALKIARVYVNDKLFIVGWRLSLKNQREKPTLSTMNKRLVLKCENNLILKKWRVARISASKINPCESALILETPTTPILGIRITFSIRLIAQPMATIQMSTLI